MSPLGARAVAFWFSIIVGWLPLVAQSSSYHLEFDDIIPGDKSGCLVNDSEKPIEAFAASQRCQRPDGRSGGGTHGSRDILDSGRGPTSDMLSADASGPPLSGVIETGARWRTGISVIPENGDCQTQVNAVLFSDGSFEGEDAAVRGLKAHRDGLAASANYWADRVSREKPDGSTLDALHAALKQRLDDDRMKQQKYWPDNMHRDRSPLFWQYWSGWLQVERNLELHFPKELGQEKASDNFREVADEINQWKKKIDGNLALQKLNVVFPPISELLMIAKYSDIPGFFWYGSTWEMLG
jgi:hypothetical protein